MNDTVFDIMTDLQFQNSQLMQLHEIFITVLKWFECSRIIEERLSPDFTDRMYILTDCHKRMTEDIKTKLDELWNELNTKTVPF